MLNFWVLNSNDKVQIKNPIYDSRCGLVYHFFPMHSSLNYLCVMWTSYRSWEGREFKVVRQVWKLDALLTHHKESCLGKRAACTPTLRVGILSKKRHCLACLRGVGCQTSEKGPHVTLLDRVEMVAWYTDWGMKEVPNSHVHTINLISLGARVASKISYRFRDHQRKRKWWSVCQNVYHWYCLVRQTRPGQFLPGIWWMRLLGR